MKSLKDIDHTESENEKVDAQDNRRLTEEIPAQDMDDFNLISL